jgi:hypothetical protein
MKKKESPFIKVRRNLFTIDGDEFQCTLLRKTFKVETFLGKDDASLDAETNEEGIIASVENSYPSSNSSSNSFPKLSSDLSSNSFLKLHYNVCPRAGASPIKDKKIKDKSSTGVLQKEPTTMTTNFHDVVELIFPMSGWVLLKASAASTAPVATVAPTVSQCR